MSTITIVTLVSMGIVLISLFINWVIRYQKKTKEKLAEFAQSLGAEIDPGSWKKQAILSGKIDDTDYIFTFHVVSTGNSSVTYLDLKTPVSLPKTKLKARKMTRVNKFFDKMGLQNPISSGDMFFDDNVLITGNPEENIKQILYKPYFKENLKTLVSNKFEVTVNGSSLVASKVYNSRKDLDLVFIKTNLQALTNAAKEINSFSSQLNRW